ncbi:hypothetical protein ABRP91_16880 [Pectobacterium brasiliense]|uniref:hypothetical protein n=1 Tax=Pectobacterium brasiliense TaxID=180957 RepID=UPI0032F0111B
MGKIKELNSKVDIANNFINLAFKIGVAFGGTVLIFYCWRIGYFPQDVSVGDGLLFILLAVAFGSLYLFFVVCLTSLGLVLRPVWHGLQRLLVLLLKGYNKITGKNLEYTPFIIEKARPEVFIFAIFGIFFIINYGFSNIKTLATLILCVWGGALVWSLYQQNSRDIFLLERKGNLTDDDSRRLKNLSSSQPVIISIVLVIPLLIGGVTWKLLDGSMRLINIRTDATVVHIKEPYVKYATEYGLNGEESNFGSEYAKFKNVSILFNGFGRNIVIEMKGLTGAVSLVIPSDYVYIVKNR